MARENVVSFIIFVTVLGWAFVCHAAAESSSLREHADIIEWIAKGLLLFFGFEVWRNQRTLFERSDKQGERLARIEGYCRGRTCDDTEEETH